MPKTGEQQGISRRDFLRQSGVVLGGLFLRPRRGWEVFSKAEDPNFIPELKGRYAKEFDPTKIESFVSGKPLVTTPFYYWYDPETGAHIKNADGTDADFDHPVGISTPEFGYRSLAWVKQEILDMSNAGIDVFLPVYWGLPKRNYPENVWSDGGLEIIVRALSELRREHPDRKFPKIGMFFDTYSLNQINDDSSNVDLNDPEKEKYFAKNPADFWSQIPAQFWACIDGKPIIMTYTAEHVAGYSQQTFAKADQILAQDFKGTEGYWITTADWTSAKTDANFKWGAALYGPLEGDKVVSIGPGFDESRVPGRPEQRKRARHFGKTYAEDWQQVLRGPKKQWIFFLETWNEIHEGTSICRTKENGDLYIQLTRKYVDLLHRS